MDEEKKYKLKAFLWDQFILPLYSLFTTEQLRSIMIGLIIINFLFFKSALMFYILTALIIITSILDLIKYYKSGEYLKNYREYKYPEYRKAIKEIRKARKERDSNDEKKIQNTQEVSTSGP